MGQARVAHGIVKKRVKIEGKTMKLALECEVLYMLIQIDYNVEKVVS